jgi:dihydroorotase
MAAEATYDLVIRGGTLLDPAQSLNDRRDVAIKGGKVAAVAPTISDAAAQTIDATGKLVVPGLVDAHVHIYEGVSHYGINPDETCLAHGATTVVDAGSAGADTFLGFRKYIIETSATRILAHLNISSMGMLSLEVGELDDIKWANIPKALATVEQHRDLILGIKVRLTRDLNCSESAGIRPLYLAREAADAAGLPLMIHPQDSWAETLDEVLGVLRAGDIMTHTYHGMRHGILDEEGKIHPAVRAARDRGVHFDVGHGQGSFSWDVCERALGQEFEPTTISSDLHKYNVNGPVFDLVTTISKFLLLGVPLETAIEKATATPAKIVGMAGRIGTLAPGAEADVAVLDLVEGDFSFVDSHGVERKGELRLAPRVVLKAGREYPVAAQYAHHHHSHH